MIRLFKALPKAEESRVIGRQLLRSGTAVGANYRAVCRSRSRAEFVAKMGVVIEESDESLFWLELLVDAGIVSKKRLEPLMSEASQILAVCAAAFYTAKRRRLQQ